MERRRRVTLLLLGAVTAGLGVAAASDSGTAGGGRSGRLRRRRDPLRRMSIQEDGGLDDGLVLNDDSICRSIIAVGGFVPPRHRRLRKDDEENVLDGGGLAGMMEPRIRLPEPTIEFLEPPLNVANSSNATNSTMLSTAFSVPDASEGLAADTDEEFVCELRDGSSLPLKGTDEQLSELRAMLHNGTLVSAESSVEAESIESDPIIDGDGAAIGMGNATREYVALPPGAVRVIHDTGRKRRRLNSIYTGEKKVLVVRVVDADGRAVGGDAAYVSDKFFGNGRDGVTMTSGFAACSFGQFTVTNDYGASFPYGALSAPGVLEVRIGLRLPEITQEALRNAAAVAAQQKLGMYLPGPFDHVAFVVERCYQVGGSCAFAAYAYVNHWLSLYVEDNYRYPGVQMHEIGHNLNLAHSGGLDGKTYTDHTCLMGNPLWEDDVGRMCFNAVKNYQIAVAGSGWYDRQRIEVFDTGANGGTSWRGRIAGVAEYDRSNYPIVVKIETGRSDDWFIGFNRQTGPHADNQQAQDRLTVHSVQAGNGLSYSTSALKGHLGQLQQGTIANWRGSGQELKIKVNAINTDVVPGYADVEISFGPQAVGPVRLSGNANKCMTSTQLVSTGNVFMADCREDDPNQIFMYDNDTMEIRRGALCLDSSLHTPNIYLYQCNGQTNQKWTYDWRYQQMTTLREKARRPTRCMDMNTNDAGANKNLYMHLCHGLPNQKFAVPSKWEFPRRTTQMKTYADADKCMDVDPDTQSLYMSSCQDDEPSQLFEYDPSTMEMTQGGRCVAYNVLNNDVDMKDCNGQANQHWIYNFQTFELRTLQNNRCLDMKLDGSGNLHMNKQCNGLQNQKFAEASKIVSPFPSYTKRIRVYSNRGKCMEAAPDNNLYMNACRSEEYGTSQLFHYDPSTRQITQGYLCVDYNVDSGNVALKGCSGEQANQKWVYDFQAAQLRSAHDGRCLDMRKDGSGNLYVYGCFDAQNQQFTAAFAAPPGLPATPQPSRKPTKVPTESPSSGPTASPSAPLTASPTKGPTLSPSVNPTSPPSLSPSSNPTKSPTKSPQIPTVSFDGGAMESGSMSMSVDYMDIGLAAIPIEEGPVFGRRHMQRTKGRPAKREKRKRE